MTATQSRASQSPSAADAPPRTPRWATVATGAALVFLAAGLLLGGGADGTDLPGLTDPGAGTRWGLPLSRLVMDLAAATTVGFALLGTLIPAKAGELTGEALRALRVASLGAVVWGAAAVVAHLLTLSDLVGLPLSQALQGQALASFTLDVEQGQAYAVVVVLAATLAIAARLTLRRSGAVALLVLALATLVPPALTGHSSGGDYHHPAATSLIVHVVAVSLWVGGLVAILVYAGSRGSQLYRVVTSYSPIAFGAAVMVAASGLINAVVRLGTPGDLLTTPYGALVLAKTVLFLVLVGIGAWHRNRTLPMLAEGRPGSFARIAAGEIAVMATTMGLAVALSRTAPPVPDVVPEASLARQLLGYPIPPEPDAARLLTEVYPDGLFFLLCTAMVVMYLSGVRRLSRRGDRWPIGRTIGWLLGTATLALSTMSGLMTYGMTMLSVHMTQHMIEAMLVPILLVLGAPITLALRAIRPARRGETGPREVMTSILGSRFLRVLTHPLVVFTIFVTAAPMVYFTELFPYAMYHHTGHILMSLHFILGGYLFFEVVVGVDPLPSRPPYLARLVMVLASAGFHAFFGVAVMQSSRLIAADWYSDLGGDISWLPDTLADQRAAGQITWGFGEIPALIVLMVLVFQWARSDDLEARRRDRRDTTKELADYNAYLASLNRR